MTERDGLIETRANRPIPRLEPPGATIATGDTYRLARASLAVNLARPWETYTERLTNIRASFESFSALV